MKRSSKVLEAIDAAKVASEAFLLRDRRRVLIQKNRKEEAIYDLLGVKKEETICYTTSFEEIFLKLIYEILLPKATKTGKNEILIPNSFPEKYKSIFKRAELAGLSIKEVAVDNKGILSKEMLQEAISLRTVAFVSFWIDPITGGIFPVFDLTKLCKEKGVFSFIDVTESVGKVLFRYQDMEVDMICCGYEDMVAVAQKNQAQMMQLGLRKNIHLEKLYAFGAFSSELLEKMDVEAYEYARIKNEIMDRYEGQSGCVFYNKGSHYLFDRWCFAFPGIIGENLAFLMREKGVYIEHIEVDMTMQKVGFSSEEARQYLVWRFDLFDSKEKIISNWEQMITLVGKSKEVAIG